VNNLSSVQIAMAMLVAREHSQQELQIKLVRKGVSESEASRVIEDLVHQGLQSDLRYAHSYILSRVNRGYGPAYIRQALKAKGVLNDVINEAISEFDSKWLEIALKAWRKKFEKPSTELKQRLKQQRFLYNRGFDTAIISQVFKKAD
jgi:regulatory protein